MDDGNEDRNSSSSNLQEPRSIIISMNPVMKINAFQYDTKRHTCENTLSLVAYTDHGEVSGTRTALVSHSWAEERFYSGGGKGGGEQGPIISK